MKPMTSTDLRGNWATILLPINEDESIDFRRLEIQINHLIQAGVNGIYCNGTAAEFYNQTEDEFDAIALMLAENCTVAGMPFQLGVSHMSPITSLNRLLRSRILEPSAFQVILPDWYPVESDERIYFLQKMAEAAEDVGLVLYNPGVAKVTLSPTEIAEVKNAVPQLIGVKGAWDRKIRDLCPDLAIFVPGHQLATGIAEGASGAYSNVSCLNPFAAQQWYESMEIDMESALELEHRIQSFVFGHVVPYINDLGFSDQAADKFMACIGGWTDLTTRIRWPYESIPPAEVAQLGPIAREMLPEFF